MIRLPSQQLSQALCIVVPWLNISVLSTILFAETESGDRYRSKSNAAIAQRDDAGNALQQTGNPLFCNPHFSPSTPRIVV